MSTNSIRNLDTSPSMTGTKKILGASLLAVFSVLLMPTFARASDTPVTLQELELDVLFAYGETDLDSWKPSFEKASALLYDATDGHMKIGTVRFYVYCQRAMRRSEIWVESGLGGASAPYGAYGKNNGEHILLSEIHKEDTATRRGYLGIVHELGHYVFSLRDEYGGDVDGMSPPGGQYMWKNNQVTVAGGGEAFYCSSEVNGSSCIMDAGTTITSAFSRTEWCCPSDHVVSTPLYVWVENVDNPSQPSVSRTIANLQEHDSVHPGASTNDCWSVVADYLGLSSVPNPPVDSPPSGSPIPDFYDMGTTSRFVLCMDISGSMSSDNRLEVAKEGAMLLVDKALFPWAQEGIQFPGDELALVAFESNVTVPYPINEMALPADKDAINQQIAALQPLDMTAMGDGLRQSLLQLQGQGSAGCMEAIILLSDGYHNWGSEEPDSVLPDVVSRKAIIFTVGVGPTVDSSLLANLATETDGSTYHARDSSDVQGVFLNLVSDMNGHATLTTAKRQLEEGGQSTTLVYVDPTINGLSFNVTGEAGFVSSLTSPSGEVSSAQYQAPGVTYKEIGLTQIYEVQGAETGTWAVGVTRTARGLAQFDLVVVADSFDILTPRLDVGGPHEVDFTTDPNVELLVTAAASEGGTIIGAHVMADVERPDGHSITIPLHDDGMASHGDAFASDGIYSTLWDQYSGDGVYIFTVRADTTGGFITPGEDWGTDVSRPATPAQRAKTHTVNVIGAPTPVIDCFGVNAFRMFPLVWALLMNGSIHVGPNFYPEQEEFTIRVIDVSDGDFKEFVVPFGGLTRATWTTDEMYEYEAPFGSGESWRFRMNLTKCKWRFDVSSGVSLESLLGPVYTVEVVGSISGVGSATFTANPGGFWNWTTFVPPVLTECCFD